MIKKMLAITMVRKIAVFAVVFVVAIVSMGTAMLPSSDAAPESDAVQVSVMNAATPPGSGKELLILENMPSEHSVYSEAAAGEPKQADSGAQVPPETANAQEASTEVEGTAQVPAEPGAEFFYSPPPEWDGTSQDFCYLPELPLSKELQQYTHAKCEDQGIEYTLVLALMWRESGFQTQAVGHNTNGTSDSGIMQINDVNKEWLLRELDIDNLLDPYQNIDAGTEILGRFTEKYGAHNALLAYQYGEGGMQKKLGQGVTTNSLIEKLYRKKAEFDELIGQAQG